jgi:hypothetical protein
MYSPQVAHKVKILYSRHSASRLGSHIPQFLPIIITHVSAEDADDELKEICFQSLESFVIRCPTEISPFVDRIVNLALQYLKYDPNYAADDDDDEVRKSFKCIFNVFLFS